MNTTHTDSATGLASLLDGTTPGPWKADGLLVTGPDIDREFGGPWRKYRQNVACVSGNGFMEGSDLEDEERFEERVNGIQGNNFRFPGFSESEANARLIAAAPALAASHAELVRALEEIAGNESTNFARPLKEIARTALANARKIGGEG